MHTSIRYLTLLASLALCACTSSDHYSFIDYTSNPYKFAGGGTFPEVKPTDADVLRFSSHVATLMRAKATGSRITREVSSTTQTTMAGLAGTSAAFSISKSGLAVLGLGSALIPQIQGIFNAKGRAEAYTDAVRLIETGQNQYLSLNQDKKAINSRLTQNGVTLLQVTQASIHVVEKTLSGRIPSVIEMQQATERMSREGATATAPGTAFNYIGADGDSAARRAQIDAAIEREVAKMTKRQPITSSQPLKIEPLEPTEWRTRVGNVTTLYPKVTNEDLMAAYNKMSAEPLTDATQARTKVNEKLQALRNVTLIDGKVPATAVQELMQWERNIQPSKPKTTP